MVSTNKIFTCELGNRSWVPPEVLNAFLDCIDWGVWQLILTAELERVFDGSIEAVKERVGSMYATTSSVEGAASEWIGNRNVPSSDIALWPIAWDGCTLSLLLSKWASTDVKGEYW